MSLTPDQFTDYLGPEESVTSVYPATLSDDRSRKPASLGVTDRRLLCLAEDGTFVTVGHDAIRAVRSRPRTTVSYRGNDYRLVVGCGALLAAVGLVTIAGFAGTPLPSLLALVSAGGVVAGASLWRADGRSRRSALARLSKSVDHQFDDLTVPAPLDDRLPDDLDTDRLLLGAGTVVPAVALAALVVVRPRPAVYLGLLSVLGGAAVLDYAVRHRSDLDGVAVVRRTERDVSVSTDDGRTIEVRADPSEAVGRELGRLVVADATDAGPVATRQP